LVGYISLNYASQIWLSQTPVAMATKISEIIEKFPECGDIQNFLTLVYKGTYNLHSAVSAQLICNQGLPSFRSVMKCSIYIHVLLAYLLT